LGLRCEPAKYSRPGRPNSGGEAVKVCQTKKLLPSQKAASASGFKAAG